MTNELNNALEALVDASDLATVLRALADVAVDKAHHIKTDWQDDLAAKPWAIASGFIYAAVHKVEKLGV